jgi:3-oxoacyl-[acyl-carrier protein] reductase
MLTADLDLHLADKVAVVTGSSRGLGLASAKALLAEGCRVCLCARGAERLAEAAVEVEAIAKRPNMVIAVQADVSTAAGSELVINRTVDAFGGLDVLVNNVGRAGGSDLLGTSDAEWQAAIDETLFPAIRASRAAVPHLKQRGGGAIIMIASIYGRESGGRMTYNAVKAAEISLAKALARQLAGANIRVNSIAPGSILFPGGSWHKRQQADPQGIAEFVRRELPFGRFGRPEEVGAVVVFLASPRASWISGACVVVDGGQSHSNI